MTENTAKSQWVCTSDCTSILQHVCFRICCAQLSDEIPSLQTIRKFWHRFGHYRTKRIHFHWNVRKFNFRVTCVLLEMMEAESKVIVNWSNDVKILKGSCQKYNLNKDLAKVLHRRLCSFIGTIVPGFTNATITSTSGERSQFYAHPCFQGHHWYDWALVHFQEWTTKEKI